MTPLSAANTLPTTSTQTWAQTSFLPEAAAETEAENAPRELEEVLGIADRAADSTGRRDALNRLYDSLAERAMQRGRKPVPKHSHFRKAP